MADLNDLFVFTRVVDAGSFTAAARELGLPKSTVSRRVSRLEDRLGARLLQRTTRRLGLTDAGRIYYERGSRIVADVEETERAVTDMQATPRGLLRISAPSDMSSRIIPLIAEFLELHPDVEVDIDLSDRFVNLVDEGFDLAIRAGRLRDSTLIARKLIEPRWSLVASPAYLERRGRPTCVAELAEHDCIIFPTRRPTPKWKLRSEEGSVEVEVHGRVSVSRLDAARDAALAGLGIAMVPSTNCAGDFEAGRLVPLFEGAGLPSTAVWAVYPSSRHLAPKVVAFVDFLRQQIPARWSR